MDTSYAISATPKYKKKIYRTTISEKNKSNRVDINILRSKLEEQESREFKKNLSIFSLCALLLVALGVYLSL